MTSNLQFGIAIPQFVADGAFDPAAFRTYLARAEALGLDSAWAMEQVLGSTPFLSPIETMTYAAACTERLRLGCAVLVTPLHSPVQLAKSLATLDQLSRGRIDVGVACGGEKTPVSALAHGPPPPPTPPPRRSGSEAATPPPSGGRCATGMASSAPDRQRPLRSPSRYRSCARRWRRPAGSPAPSGSPSASTSPLTTMASAPDGGSPSRWSASTGGLGKTLDGARERGSRRAA